MRLSIKTYCKISNDSVNLNGTVSDQFKNSKELLKDLYHYLEMDYPKFYKMDNISKLGLIGVEMLKQTYPQIVKYGENDLAIILQSEKGCLESDNNHQARVDEKSPSPAIFVYTLSNIVIGEISIKHKWFGESVMFIGESADIDNVIRHTRILLATNKSQNCLIGWLDSYNDEHQLKMAIIEKSEDGLELNSGNLKHIFEN